MLVWAVLVTVVSIIVANKKANSKYSNHYERKLENLKREYNKQLESEKHKIYETIKRQYQEEDTRRKENYVREFSTKYQNLSAFIDEVSNTVHKARKELYVIEFDSLNKYKNFNYNRRFISSVKANREYFESFVCDYITNKKVYDGIIEVMSQSSNLPKEYEDVENSLLDSIRLVVPLDFSFTYKWVYDSPGRRAHQEDSHTYSPNDIKAILDNLDKSNGNGSFSDEQRRLMTPSLRYRVLKRDGFKCVRCGRSPEEDGVKLEVDHIIPIAKGGKTEESNLQTLCRDCNRGKGARY